MNTNFAIRHLKQAEVFLEGHFLLSSGKHSNRYCQCARLFEQPKIAAKVVSLVAEQLRPVAFDLIVGPAMGGILPAYELSRLTGKRNCFTEREDDNMCLRRGFEFKPGTRIIIMEDVITTGKSTCEVADVLRLAGGQVVGAACVVDRSEKPLPFPVFAATKLLIETYNADDCPLCREGVPIVKPGSRKMQVNDKG